MLVGSDRYTDRDLEQWRIQERQDAVWSRTRAHRRKVERAKQAVHSFARDGMYVGVSWGKDSVVVADMVLRLYPDTPLVWVRVEPIANPDCHLVSDEFLRMHPTARYDEIEVWCRWGDGEWHARGTLESGFKEAERRHGGRHISGVRADESGARKMRFLRWGFETERTCAPISHWSSQDVFAYLYERDLPAHPAYAMSMGGIVDRGKLRVASLGGKRGDGFGRSEWEQRYYGRELRRLQCPG